MVNSELRNSWINLLLAVQLPDYYNQYNFYNQFNQYNYSLLTTHPLFQLL